MRDGRKEYKGEYKGKQTSPDLLLLSRLFVVIEADNYEDFTISQRQG